MGERHRRMNEGRHRWMNGSEAQVDEWMRDAHMQSETRMQWEAGALVPVSAVRQPVRLTSLLMKRLLPFLPPRRP